MATTAGHGTGDALQRSEQRARLALEVARLGTWTWSLRDGQDVLEVDARCREICGLGARRRITREELMARVHPGDRAQVDRALQAALDPAGDGQYSAQMRFLHADGMVCWAVARGATTFAGEGADRHAVELLGSLVDITEQVSASDKYRNLFEAIDRGFCVIEVLFDEHGKALDYVFLETNPCFVDQTGLLGAIGRRMRELAPAHEEHWFELYGEVARTGVPIRFEHPAAALDRWYDVYAYRVGDPLSHQVGVLFADITRRKRTEQALRDADRRKDEFLATLAHELRNPLAPLRTALDVLGMSEDPATARRLHAVMARQVDQLTRLVDDLMEVSRITRGQVELRLAPVDMATVLRDAVETSRPLLDRAGQTLTIALPEEPLPVEADALRLAQVVTNLLNNAARYGRPGGSVGLHAWREGAQVAVAVRDDGIGIPRDKLRTIFDPFIQLDRDARVARAGLGIGLSLVRSLVHMHGGEVAAFSEGEGRGSEFVVRLPANGRPAPAGA